TRNNFTVISGTNKIYTSFTAPALTGNYNLTYFANDTSNNVNATEKSNFTVSDVVRPSVSALLPTAGSTYNVSNTVHIASNVTDDAEISTVYANLTYPNGTVIMENLSLVSGTSKYNISFTTPALLGTYNLTYFANDTSNNVNATGKSNFTVNDLVPPTMTNLACEPSGANLTNIVSCNATITDDFLIDTVTANVTLPNSSVIVQTVSNTSSLYNFTFINTTSIGAYTVTWSANDSSNNLRTNTTTFTVSDVTVPAIALNTPLDYANVSTPTLSFNFTPSDNYDATLNCSLMTNGTIVSTDTAAANGTPTVLSATLTNGTTNWNITCVDDAGNSNTSATRHVVIDTVPPSFVSLTTTPSVADDLDPGLNISVFGSVNDNITAISAVLLAYKLSNDTNYGNITLSYNITSDKYEGNFNATVNGTYNLRLTANDTAGNTGTSNLVNRSVQFEHTWTVSPTTLGPYSRTAGQVNNLGNLTFNNTGDFTLSFSINSSRNTTTYNSSTNFTLASKETTAITVNETAPADGTQITTLTINATGGDPARQNVTGTIIVAPGQPILSATITTPSTATVAVTQGDTGVAFAATLENIGEGNASNVSFTFAIPSDWILTFGSTQINISELNPSDTLDNDFEVTIPSDATTGTFTITANATGVNGSGAPLENNSLVFGDTVSVTVSAPATLGSPASSGGGAAPSSTSASSTGGGGGISRAANGVQASTIETSDTIAVTRGNGISTPVHIANLWNNSFMQDITLDVTGYLAGYTLISPSPDPVTRIEVETHLQLPQQFTLPRVGTHIFTLTKAAPDKVTATLQSQPQTIELTKGQPRYVDLDDDRKGDIVIELLDATDSTARIAAYSVQDYTAVRLPFGSILDYALDVYAPSYLLQQDYTLQLKISAQLVSVDGTVTRPMTEYRTLQFLVREVAEEDAQALLDAARNDVRAMDAAGFNIIEAQNILDKAAQAFAAGDYDAIAQSATLIARLHDDAFAAHDLLLAVNQSVERAAAQWLTTPQTTSALQLATLAFERGDYAIALKRAKNAQLLYVLETKNRVNLIKFVIDHWGTVLLAALALAIILYAAYKRLSAALIEQRLRNINHEEQTIQELLQETQKRYLKDRAISATQYARYTQQYENRLTELRQLRVHLRNTRVAIMKLAQELRNIKREKIDIHDLLTVNQTDYFVKHSISRRKFADTEARNRTRRNELEQEEALLESKLEQQQGSMKNRILTWIDRIEKIFDKS
ncbi:hypothetical protein HY492_03755, partial [Candidatus Woesearchaeota archaeon]|nr:hypothetical protein [Candidatus Woesearchaeota archaeon]